MSPIKIKKVISCSSEDPLFPASNILVGETWKCGNERRAQEWVLLQLEDASNIDGLEIGNAGAAFIEVQVGKMGTDLDQMKTLLVPSSFMLVNEARLGENMARERVFWLDELGEDFVNQKWDLVKVNLTQPFNKALRYGLSMLTMYGIQQPSLGEETKQNDATGKKDVSASNEVLDISEFGNYSDIFKRKVVKFSEDNTVMDTSIQFAVSASSVRLWKKQSRRKEKTPKKSVWRYSNKVKQEAVNYAQKFSINDAADKFEVHHSTIRNWLKEAKGGSKTKFHQYDVTLKNSILKFVRTNSKEETCKMFGVARRTLNDWIYREKACNQVQAESETVKGQEDEIEDETGGEVEHGPKWRANPLHSEDETENEQFTLEKIELQAKWNEEVQIINRKFEKKMEELKKRYE
jgi:transposase-like protein